MQKRGFTLVELLAVVLIIAILTVVGLPQYKKVVEKARVSEAQSMLRVIYDSGERLAGEFGYSSYASMFRAIGASKVGFSRLDMFSTAPAGCEFSEKSKIEMECSRYRYKIIVGDYVVAQRKGGTYDGTLIGLNRNDGEVYCKDSANNNGCEIFGLEIADTLSY